MLGRLACLLKAPGPPRFGRLPAPKGTPKALQGRGLGRCVLEAPGPPLGGLPALKAPQSPSKDGANMRPVTPKQKQTKASALELRNT
jgi:hypothetical protein